MSELYRSFILAVQFLTRLPTPQIVDFEPQALSRSSHFFPAVGLIVGALVGLALWVGTWIDPWVGAALALAVWVFVTGALHLDGLSDMADAMGATHQDPARFHAVLKDPHVGTFGVVTLIVQLLLKFTLLMMLARENAFLLLVPLCAWARLGPLFWASYLPVLKAPEEEGAASGERFSWEISAWVSWGWGLLLFATATLSPAFLAAPAILLCWGLYLRARLGGQTGDLLGAGIEVSETVLLFVLVAMIM